jgi:hypothetical protein
VKIFFVFGILLSFYSFSLKAECSKGLRIARKKEIIAYFNELSMKAAPLSLGEDPKTKNIYELEVTDAIPLKLNADFELTGVLGLETNHGLPNYNYLLAFINETGLALVDSGSGKTTNDDGDYNFLRLPFRVRGSLQQIYRFHKEIGSSLTARFVILDMY